MSRRFSLTLGLYLLFLTFVVNLPEARAQSGPDIFVTPVPNSPFTGEIEVERSIVRPDGVVMNMRTARKIGRDNRGRIFNEARTLVPVSGSQFPQVETIHLYDPETRVSTMLNVHGRTFWTMIVRRPPATMPPALVEAAPVADALQRNEFTTKEDLGFREIGGVAAHGVRETQKISVDEKRSGQPVTVVDEYWYSDDLRINLVIKHDDPRTGSVKMMVGEIQRAEPDPALFEIPKGYKRVENR